MNKIFFLLYFLAGLFFTPRVFADEGWVINSFHSEVVIESSGEVSIAETITVDFGALEKHGIFRDIPYVYERDGVLTYTTIHVQSVLQDSEAAEYEEIKNKSNLRIKIGDADKTISGIHRYVIAYKVTGVLRSFSSHDELYWNVTGDLWPVPIENASATVILPAQGIQKVICFEGALGATTECSASVAGGKMAQFSSTRSLASSEGLTIVVGYEKGMVPILAVTPPKSLVEQIASWPSLMTLFIAVFAGIITAIVIWYRNGRDYWFKNNSLGSSQTGEMKPVGGHETTVVEFEPPENLLPAQVGVLMDETADTRDVVATIIDLAVRGHLTITEVPKKWLFGSTDYILTQKTKDEKDLLSYEKKLLDELFSSGKEIKVSSLKRTFYEDLSAIKKLLYEDVVSKKLFPSNPDRVRMKYAGIAVLICFLGGGIVVFSFIRNWIFTADLGIGILTGGIVMLIFSPFMSRRSAKGRELARRIRGYQLFIGGAEKYRQRFYERKNLLNEILPYAIVFGMTEKFMNAMREIGVEKIAPNWYYGTQVFNSQTFASSMNSFSDSLSSAIASSPKSSGFSGGASSGGGFGGGGGGSW